jgi:PAS domain S-box-containing protein
MLYLSEGVKELTGYSARRFLSEKLSFTSLYHPDDGQRIRTQVEAALANNEQFHLVYRLRHAEGGWRWVEELGQGVFDEHGKLAFLEGTLFDITQRKLAEDALKAAHAELEQRVRVRTRELESTNDRLRREIAERRGAEDRLLAERELLLKTLNQHENHRRLVSYEIHDGVAAYVFAALMHLETYARRVEPVKRSRGPDDADGIRDEARLELAIGLLRKTQAEARRLISGLRPPILDESGIVAAVKYLIGEQSSFAGQIDFRSRLEDQRFAPLLEIALFRIVQEALTNIVKHSGAKKARIHLSQNRGRLELTVRDWGKGFEADAVVEQRFGLLGIRERARLLGGLATIESAPGKGTRITVDLPVMQAETIAPSQGDTGPFHPSDFDTDAGLSPSDAS